MRKIILLLVAAFSFISPLFAISSDDVSAESIVSLLSDNGFSSYIDEDGDVTVEDQYGMEYWIMLFPEEGRLWIQSGWGASADVKSADANRIVNECNNSLYLIRCSYDPMYRTFYCDYDFYYHESGIDDGLLVSIISIFFDQADVYTDYLIGEGAI